MYAIIDLKMRSSRNTFSKGGEMMKSYIHIFNMLILLILSSCTTASMALPEKYSLDDQLERVTGISRYRVTEWHEVDQQSLIIKTGLSEYYLLVLDIPSNLLLFTDRISITSSASTILAGFDRVTLYYPGSLMDSYKIERIYRIKDRKQMRSIKKQLNPNSDKKDVVVN